MIGLGQLRYHESVLMHFRGTRCELLQVGADLCKVGLHKVLFNPQQSVLDPLSGELKALLPIHQLPHYGQHLSSIVLHPMK